jgi:phosphonate transport system substrate-binding protein
VLTNTGEKEMKLKKVSASLLAIAMLSGCSSTASTTATAAATAAATGAATTSTKAAPAASGSKDIDDLKIEFVPSKDADVIITGTAGLDQLLIDAMKEEGYNIGRSTSLSVPPMKQPARLWLLDPSM